MPGYQLPITATTDKSWATLDVLGLVRDASRTYAFPRSQLYVRR